VRWGVFAIFGFMALSMDKGLVDLLAFNELGGIEPSICGVLVVFVSLFATRAVALWSSWLLGLMLDLSTPPPYGDDMIAHILGPHALGFAFGCYLILQVRPMVFRRRALTVGALTFACLLAAYLVWVALFTVRSYYPEPHIFWTSGSALSELARRFFMALYAGVVGVPVGWLLLKTWPIWGFAHK
jgi:rod shape-determining protein MreD